MVKRIVWLTMSCLIVVALILASCGPAEEEEEEAKTVVGEVEEVEEEGEEEEVAVTKVEGPIYGGEISVSGSKRSFSPAPLSGGVPQLMYEALLVEDWARGPSGTGEFAHDMGTHPPESLTGMLAESYEQLDLTTFIFYLRKGVRFHNTPPVNGREFVADDVVFSFEWHQANPRSFIYKRADTPEEGLFRAIALDKYTVKVITPEPDYMWRADWGQCLRIMPREIGELDLEDWTNACGTGPFIVVDYVDGSSTTCERNPVYWMKDPVHPDNTLPYLEVVKELVITDRATQLAALRTGKIPRLVALDWLEARSLKQTNPELKYRTSPRPTMRPVIMMRVDYEPFDNVKVRRALHMAIDWEGIAQDYYEGEATILTWPFYPHHEGYYTPLEELPDSARELYSYNPEKAIQLLAEAGYPNGFETHMLLTQSTVELMSLIKNYYSDIGVDLELRVIESSAFSSYWYGKKHTAMIVSTFHGNPSPGVMFKMFYGPGVYNWSNVSDPYIDEEYEKVSLTLDVDEQKRILRELGIYTIEQCYDIVLPCTPSHIFWQPWLKGYNGEYFNGAYWNTKGYLQYCWIDEELKEEMGH